MYDAVFGVGTRGSVLSLLQTQIVTRKLEALGIRCEIVKIKTLNEKIDRSKVKETEKDIYTKEIDEALLSGSIDIAVHSLKDLKNELPKGISLASVPERADPSDAIVKGKHFSEKARPVVGTSSIRRRAQIPNLIKGAYVEVIHGNVDTRLKALSEGKVDALVLAYAGLERLGYASIAERIDPEIMVPAIGQGALAVTARSDDMETIKVLRAINDKDAEKEVMAERAFGRAFGIGCDVPIGALARITGGSMRIVGFIADTEGKRIIKEEISGKAEDCIDLGNRLAALVKNNGGDGILGTGK